MKAHRFLLVAALFMSASLMFASGCKYNVTTPLWDQPYKASGAPQITSVVPTGEARPGLQGNVITIYGHNFIIASPDTLTPDTTIVYFNTLQANVMLLDSNKIVVRRPNLVADSCTIKVSVHNAIVEPTVGGYKIDQVTWQYGGFLQNIALAGIAVDNQGYVFVTQNSTTPSILKATSTTDNTTIGSVSGVGGSLWGASVGPDGNLYITSGVSTRWITKVLLSTDSVNQKWVQLPSGKVAKCGDFSAGGYFFTGGTRTDLLIIPPYASGQYSSGQLNAAGFYASDTILAVKVYDGYAYVAWRPVTSPAFIQISRHQLTSDSTLGPRRARA